MAKKAPAQSNQKRQARYFDVPRLMHSDTITAQEIQNIRSFGSETELMQIETEVARRVNGPTGLTSNIEYTWEYQRLAAIQGMCLDSDGEIKFDWFQEFGIQKPGDIVFDLSLNADGSAKKLELHSPNVQQHRGRACSVCSASINAGICARSPAPG